MADKYIIEKHEKDSIWRMYADAYGDVTVEGVDLTPYAEPDTEKVREEAYRQGYDTGYGTKVNKFYEQGLIDAWDAARWIVKSNAGVNFEVFGKHFISEILQEISASEAIERIRQYEQEQEEEQIQVGDEVTDDKGDTGVCTEISYPANSMHIMYADGTATDISLTGVTQTGRRFPEIATVLAKMKEEQP